MKKIYTTLISLLVPIMMQAQGWPANYNGVMLQAFYWNSYDDTNWNVLASQADDLATTFDLIWLPQSGNCGGQSMGYDDLYWFPGHYNSSFGNETELRSLITTFKNKGMKTIADVVINHRKSNNGWFGFPTETYQGVTYTMGPSDVCRNDDGGKALAEANRLGVTLGNNDTGEDWDGMRDLDHKSTNVQNTVKAYLKMLIQDLGYAGFRYDMVKGYAGTYTKLYNEYAQPTFSVGECWDGSNTIRNWINATNKTSAAFDFQFKYVVRNATDKNDWTWLGKQNDGNWPLVSSSFEEGGYRQWAVTFVENHDTEVRPDGSSNGPLKKDTLAANAFLLAMPGTPCIFLKHWIDYKQDLKSMVTVRKTVGITNTSSYTQLYSNKNYYIVETTGTNGNLICSVGSKADQYNATSKGYTKVISGYHYVYWMSNSMETAWADKASGEYTLPLSVKLTAVSATSDAQLVYTLDGSTPTASSTKVSSGTVINITNTCTLTIGLIKNGTVSGITTRNYTISTFEPYAITIYCNADNVGWNNINYWTWGGDGTHTPTNSEWPGDRIIATKTINGKTWWYKTYTINSKNDCVNFVFSTNEGKPQTVDITNINRDTYFEISTDKNDDKFTVNNVTETMTGIEQIKTESKNIYGIYTIDGRRLSNMRNLPHGIYILNGKKYIK